MRRIPYAFSVSRPRSGRRRSLPLRPRQSGDTRSGTDRARVYRWPTSPFCILGIFGVDPSVNDDGREKIYALDIPRQAVNAGVVVVRPVIKVNASIVSLLSSNAPIHPWFLGSLDENDVHGYAGIPVNSNGLMPDFLFSSAPRAASSSRRVATTSRWIRAATSSPGAPSQAPTRCARGSTTCRPPYVALLTQRVSSGRPTIVARMRDANSGVDPLSLLLLFGSLQRSGATSSIRYGHRDLPRSRGSRKPLRPGPEFMRVFASDYQETKNIHTEGANPMPNTRFRGIRLEVSSGRRHLDPPEPGPLPRRRARSSSSWRARTRRSRRSGSSTASARSAASGATSPASTSSTGARAAGAGRTCSPRSSPIRAAVRPRQSAPFGSAARAARRSPVGAASRSPRRRRPRRGGRRGP